MYSRFGTTQPKDWRDSIKELKAAMDELNQYETIMTPYERETISRSIKSRREVVIPGVQPQIIAEWKAGIARYQEKDAAIGRERVKELNRWDNGRLGAEIGAVKTLVELALSGANSHSLGGGTGQVFPQLTRLFKDAMDSGDMYKQRAAAEVFASMENIQLRSDLTDRAAVHGLVTRAKEVMPEIRVTDGMLAALDERDAAVESLRQLKGELDDASVALGWGKAAEMFSTGPIAAAFRGVKFNPDKSLTIYADDSPEVTGVHFVNPEDANRSIILGGEVKDA